MQPQPCLLGCELDDENGQTVGEKATRRDTVGEELFVSEKLNN